MTSFLVSIALAFPENLALGVYDVDTREFRWVDLSALGERIAGISGLCRWDDAIWCIADIRDQRETLVRLDRSLTPTASFPLPDASRVHSVIPHQDGLLVVDTQHNRLTRLILEHGQPGIREEVVWRMPGVADDHDIVHLNSVAELRGELYVTMLDPRPPEVTKGWKEAVGGSVMDTARNTVIRAELNKPHTLSAIDGMLYWVESAAGRVWRYSEASGVELVASVFGFARGLAADERFLYVGVCARRIRSRSTGEVIDWGDTTLSLYQAAIVRIDRQTGAQERHDLTAYTHDIFDLLPLEPEDVIPPPRALPAHAERLHRIRRQYDGLTDQLAAGRAKNRKLRKQARVLTPKS